MAFKAVQTYGAIKKDNIALQQAVTSLQRRIKLLEKENTLQKQIFIQKEILATSSSLIKIKTNRRPLSKPIPSILWGHQTKKKVFHTNPSSQQPAPHSPVQTGIGTAVADHRLKAVQPMNPQLGNPIPRHRFNLDNIKKKIDRLQMKYGGPPLPTSRPDPRHLLTAGLTALWENCFILNISAKFTEGQSTSSKLQKPPPFPRPVFPRCSPPAVYICPPPRLPPLPACLPIQPRHETEQKTEYFPGDGNHPYEDIGGDTIEGEVEDGYYEYEDDEAGDCDNYEREDLCSEENGEGVLDPDTDDDGDLHTDEDLDCEEYSDSGEESDPDNCDKEPDPNGEPEDDQESDPDNCYQEPDPDGDPADEPDPGDYCDEVDFDDEADYDLDEESYDEDVEDYGGDDW